MVTSEKDFKQSDSTNFKLPIKITRGHVKVFIIYLTKHGELLAFDIILQNY